MASDCPEFTAAVELLLRRRSENFRLAFDAKRVALTGGSTVREAARLERGQLVNAWCEATEGECRLALEALGALMRLFDVVPDAQWVHERLVAHIDHAVGHLVATFGHGVASASSIPGEQRQIGNFQSRLKAGLRGDVNALVESLAREREQGAADEATPSDLDDRLPLRRRGVFDRDLAAMVAAARPDEPVSLVMIDIDHFKKVNDEHGHPVGDEVLLELSRRVVRRVASKARAYRYGGEELALLVPRYSVEEAAGLAERLRKDVEGAPIGSKALIVTASFGAAAAPDHARDAPALLARADSALYAAKREGRNRVRVAE
jgi:diguanylate cyclase (GGDEF)-like protein